MKRLLLWALVLMLFGCTGGGLSAFKKGDKYLAAGDYDMAALSYAEAVDKSPDKAEYKVRLQKAKHRAAIVHAQRADEFMAVQEYPAALQGYRLAGNLEPSIESNFDKARKAELYIEVNKMLDEARIMVRDRRFKQASQLANDALAQISGYPPALELRKDLDRRASTMIDGVELEVSSNEPITLNFKSANLADVFDILTQLSGIRFILDDAIRTQTTTLYLEGATFSQAFELLLRMNKIDKKILNSKTIILFPNSKDKKKQFADQIIQTFYLSNIDAKKAVNLLRTMLQVRKIYVHEELNAIVLRDTPQVVRLAQKIIEANDRSTSEVVFDLELVEVSHTKGLDIGPKLSNYSTTGGFSNNLTTTTAEGTTSTTALNTIAGTTIVGSLNNLKFLYSIPSVTFDIKKTAGDAEILASPKIRVKNKGKAKVHIGSREPVVTVTLNDQQTSENVQYVDVGVKLDIEPVIQLDNTIVTKLGLEVSNVSDRAETTNGTAILTISTTNANTELILKDGVQTIIGGLLRDDESKTKTTIPILGDIPLLGSLFTSYSSTKTKREILLSITPHIVRTIKLPEGNSATIWSGGEDALRLGRNFGSFADEYAEGQGKTPNNVVPALKNRDIPIQPAPGTDLPVTPLPELAEESSNNEVPELMQPAVLPPVVPPRPAVIPVTPSGTETVAPLTPVPEILLQDLQTPEAIIRPSIFLEGDRLARIGSLFTLTLAVQDVQNLFSAPLYIRYDPKLVEFVSASEGAFLKQNGEQTIFSSTQMAESGRIIVGLKQGAGGQGASGGGVLAQLEFRAKAAGKLSIAPERINFRNPAGERLTIDSRGLIVEVK